MKYHIEFDTQDMPGKIKATTIHINTEVVRDMKAKMRVDLFHHPLYKKLEKYVLANPSKKGK